ncbi:MAG: hypothetical protein ACI8RZ_007956 [Myxococcota bacterium]|jgi:hypothetical protein
MTKTWLLLLAACGGPIGDSGDSVLALTIDPGVAAPGEILIGVLSANQGLDFSRVAEVRFLDGATICATKNRADELLLTIGVAKSTRAGVLDVVVLFEGGDSILINDALTITSEGWDPDALGYPCQSG